MAFLHPLAVSLILLFHSAAPFGSPGPAQDPLGAWNRIVADWEAFERTEDPLTAAIEGDRPALARLPDLSPGGMPGARPR